MARPSFRTLEIFAMAGRCASFREAANALHISPSAVSHQVKHLEAWVGAALFVRSTRHVALTPLGQKLAGDINQHLSAIDKTLHAVQRELTETVLRISALPLFTNTWLIPRLPKFEQLWPELSIEIETVNDVVDFNHSTVDVGIRNSISSPPGLARKKLINLFSVPLCVPNIALGIQSPEDLCEQTLIVHSGRPEGWSRWFELAGHPGCQPKSTLSVDNLHSAIAAAREGAGVMLGLAPFIWDAVGVVDLVNPIAGDLVSGGAYTLVYRSEDRTRALIQAFESWIVQEIQADFHRLSRLGQSVA